MESIMRHQEASKFLRLYLASRLQLENYLFWIECEKFFNQNKRFAERICAAFIENSAPDQVNIEAGMREVVLSQVKQGVVGLTTFDKPQLEIYKVLHQNNYSAFMHSEYIKDYLKMKVSRKADLARSSVVSECGDDAME